MPYLFIFPSLFFLLILTFYPIIFTFVLSISEVTFSPRTIQYFAAGFDHYAQVLNDSNFLKSLQNAVVFIVGSTGLGLGFSMLLAMCLNEKLPYRELLRGLALLPWIVPGSITAIVWAVFFDPDYGFLNQVLNTRIVWLGPDNAMLSCMLVSVWKSSPFMIAGILAALQTVPEQLYEAADVDGANKLQRFIHITIPSIRNVVFILLMMQVIWKVNTFDIIYLLTYGGPANRTLLPAIYTYRRLFEMGQWDYGSALSIAISAILIVLIFLLRRRWEE